MATDGKIYITITDKRDGQPNAVGGEPSSPKKDENKSTALGRYAEHEFFKLIDSNAKTFVNYTISNYGNFTGNYLSQQNINTAMGNLGKLSSIGLSAIAGAKIGGVWGALIGAGVGVITETVNFGLGEKTAYFNNRRANREIEMIRDLSGLNSLTNESR